MWHGNEIKVKTQVEAIAAKKYDNTCNARNYLSNEHLFSHSEQSIWLVSFINKYL